MDRVSGRVKKAAGDLAGDEELRRRGADEERKADAKDELAGAQRRADEKAEEVARLERETARPRGAARPPETARPRGAAQQPETARPPETAEPPETAQPSADPDKDPRDGAGAAGRTNADAPSARREPTPG